MLNACMKPVYLLIFFCFSSSYIIFAQPFKGGVAAGLVGSQVAGDTYSGFHKPGAYAALWVSLDFGEHSSFYTELSYFQKGSRHNPDEKKQDFTFYLMRLGYIEMPFLYQYHLKSKLTFEIGPSVSFILHSYEELDYAEVSYGKYALFNPSLMVGMRLPVTERIVVGFRTVNSILSIRSEPINGGVYRLFDSGQYITTVFYYY
jgi:hypothetical protein